MNEQDIIKTFKVKKILTAKEFASIKDLSIKSASKALQALSNKGIMDKIRIVENDNEKEYYYLSAEEDKIKRLIEKKFRNPSPKKTNRDKENETGNFYGNFVSLLDKQVTIKLIDGTELTGKLKSFESAHLSIFLKTEKGLVMIRGNAIISISG